MPKITVTEQCERCPREEKYEVDIDEAVKRVKAAEHVPNALEIIIDGKKAVAYKRLCEECRGIVSSYCQGAQKQVKKSARRFKRLKTSDTEPTQEDAESAAHYGKKRNPILRSAGS